MFSFVFKSFDSLFSRFSPRDLRISQDPESGLVNDLHDACLATAPPPRMEDCPLLLRRGDCGKHVGCSK